LAPFAQVVEFYFRYIRLTNDSIGQNCHQKIVPAFTFDS